MTLWRYLSVFCGVLALLAMVTYAAPGSATFTRAQVEGNWKIEGGNWSVTAAPDRAGFSAVFTDAANSVNTMACMDIALAARQRLTFRVRYATPYGGMGDDRGVDKAHVPHWAITLGTGEKSVVIQDSYVWNGLLTLVKDKPEQRVNGTRPQNKWLHFRVDLADEKLQIFIDDMLVQEAAIPAGARSGISFVAVHEKFWLSELKLTALAPASLAANDLTDPDYLLRETLTDNSLRNPWRAEGTWQVVPDPEDPSRKAIFADPRGSFVATLITQRADFGDYDLTFRVRFDTPFKPYPMQDGKHYPLWKIFLKSAPNQLQVQAEDLFVWGSMALSDSEHQIGSGDRAIMRGKWHDVHIQCRGDMYSWWVNGKLVIEGRANARVAGAVGFGVMDASLWISDLKMTAHPDAMAYATFAEPLDPARWKMQGTTGVVTREKNQHFRLAAAESPAMLSAVGDFHDYSMSVRLNPELNPDGTCILLLGQRPDGAMAGIGITPARESVALGHMNSGQWAEDIPLTLDNTGRQKLQNKGWQQYRILRERDTVTIYAGAMRLAQVVLPAGVASSRASCGVAVVKGACLLDDLLIESLPVPLYRLDALAGGSIYQSSEAKGFRLELKNADSDACQVQVRCTVADASGKVLQNHTEEIPLAAGQTNPQMVALNITTPGQHTWSLDMAVNGREFCHQSGPLTVLPDMPALSPAYRSQFGFNTNETNHDILYRTGTRWIRSRGFPTFVRPDDKGIWRRTEENKIADLYTRRFPELQILSTHMENDISDLFGCAKRMSDTLHATAENYRDIAKYYEIWNEPNHGGFWRQTPSDPVSYTVILKESYNAIKSAKPDAIVIGAVTSGMDIAYLRSIYESGGGPYMDWLGYHPYGYPAKPEDIFWRDVMQARAVSDAFGGWTDHYISEHGYVTALNGSGVSEHVQAEYLVRTNLIATSIDFLRAVVLYRLEDYGSNPENSEFRFGVIHTDQTPKPAFLGIATMARQLANTEFLGRLPSAPSTYAHVYYGYDRSTVVAVWSTSEQNFIVPMEGTSAIVTDMLGNTSTTPVSSGKITIKAGTSPVYIRSSTPQSALWRRAIESTRRQKYEWLTKSLTEVNNTAVAARLKSHAESWSTFPSTPAAMERSLAAIRAFNQAVCDAYGRGELTEATAALLTDRAYSVAAQDARLMMDGGASNVRAAEWRESIERADAVIRRKGGARGSLVFAERQFNKAREESARSAALEPSSPELAAVFAESAAMLADLSAEFASVETVFYRGTLFEATPLLLTLSPGAAVDFSARIFNGEDATFPGRVEWIFPSTWKKAPMTQSALVQTDKPWLTKAAITLPDDVASGVHEIIARGYRGDTLLGETRIKISIVAPLHAQILPVTTTLDKVSELTLVLNNLQTVPFSGTLEIRDPDGNSIAIQGSSLNLAAKATARITFPFRYSGRTKYNEYAIGVQVRGKTGAVVMSDRVPLDFAVIPHTSAPVNIDGDLGDWSHAWPVHLRLGAENLDPSALSARGFAQFDERYLYLALWVQDEVHTQENTGPGIWAGDCLQVSIDPLNEKNEGGYGPHDYEMGFARATASNKQLSALWVGPDKKILEKSRFIVVRDEDTKTTRYEIAIPRAVLPATFAPGSKMGLNFGLNDAGRNFTREHMIEFTGGTTTSKNPSLYATWVVGPSAGER